MSGSKMSLEYIAYIVTIAALTYAIHECKWGGLVFYLVIGYFIAGLPFGVTTAVIIQGQVAPFSRIKTLMDVIDWVGVALFHAILWLPWLLCKLVRVFFPKDNLE